mgnify:CR=1 FL=1
MDVGAKSEIHRIIRDLSRQGLAVLMISSDLPEILGMSDRIGVMRGCIAASVLFGLWHVLPLKGEPLMTRFVAKQLGTSHWYDLTAARRDLGYEPIVDDETALQRTIGWLKGELATGKL